MGLATWTGLTQRRGRSASISGAVLKTSDGEALEGAVDAGQPEDRVGVAGRLVEEGRLGELADLGPHPLAELDRDLGVAASSQHWRAMSSLRANGASSSSKSHTSARPFQGLYLADEDAVHHLAGGVSGIGPVRRQLARPPPAGGTGCGDPRTGPPCGPPEPAVAGEILGRKSSSS